MTTTTNKVDASKVYYQGKDDAKKLRGKIQEMLCELTEKELAVLLQEYMVIHAAAWAWPASELKSSVKKLDSWLATLNDRKG